MPVLVIIYLRNSVFSLRNFILFWLTRRFALANLLNTFSKWCNLWNSNFPFMMENAVFGILFFHPDVVKFRRQIYGGVVFGIEYVSDMVIAFHLLRSITILYFLVPEASSFISRPKLENCR